MSPLHVDWVRGALYDQGRFGQVHQWGLVWLTARQTPTFCQLKRSINSADCTGQSRVSYNEA